MKKWNKKHLKIGVLSASALVPVFSSISMATKDSTTSQIVKNQLDKNDSQVKLNKSTNGNDDKDFPDRDKITKLPDNLDYIVYVKRATLLNINLPKNVKFYDKVQDKYIDEARMNLDNGDNVNIKFTKANGDIETKEYTVSGLVKQMVFQSWEKNLSDMKNKSSDDYFTYSYDSQKDGMVIFHSQLKNQDLYQSMEKFDHVAYYVDVNKIMGFKDAWNTINSVKP